MPTVWDATNKSPDVTLSGGSLTATATGSAGDNAMGSSATAVTTGNKRYWEIAIDLDLANSVGPGIVISGASYAAGEWLGFQAFSIGYYSDGNVYFNWNGIGSPIATYATFTTGDKICVATDFANGTMWFRVNGGNWNNSGAANPATNTGGLDFRTGRLGSGDVFPAYNLYTIGGDGAVTANFGATAFAQTAPSGFTGFDTSGDTLMAQAVM